MPTTPEADPVTLLTLAVTEAAALARTQIQSNNFVFTDPESLEKLLGEHLESVGVDTSDLLLWSAAVATYCLIAARHDAAGWDLILDLTISAVVNG